MMTSLSARLETTDTSRVAALITIIEFDLHGCGVISQLQWQACQPVLVSDVASNFRAAARVIYCKALGAGHFRVGLKFDSPLGPADLAADQI